MGRVAVQGKGLSLDPRQQADHGRVRQGIAHVDKRERAVRGVCRKSYKPVEELLAARFPKPAVRDLIPRLPATAAGTPDIGTGLLEAGPLLTDATTKRELLLAPELPPSLRGGQPAG
jgi:hypothetical protein